MKEVKKQLRKLLATALTLCMMAGLVAVTAPGGGGKGSR